MFVTALIYASVNTIDRTSEFFFQPTWIYYCKSKTKTYLCFIIHLAYN